MEKLIKAWVVIRNVMLGVYNAKCYTHCYTIGNW